jgi:hypothetical protein
VRRLLAALGLLASLCLPVEAQQPVERTDVRVDVRAMTGFLTPETELFVIRARAVNTTAEPVRNLRAGLRFGSQLLGRSSIAVGGSPARFGTGVADGDVPAGELTPGGTAELEFEVPLADLPFDRSPTNAVYPMRIEVRSRFEVVGAIDTYVVWWPQAGPQLRAAILWPLMEPSHRALGNDFYDDDLASSVEDGRLHTLLRLADESDVPVNWVVDPELTDSLTRMAQGYTVRGEPGTRSAVARAWLDRAKNALRGGHVIPLPYGDPDLATTAAVDAGTAFRLGRDLIRRDLDNTGDPTLGWPPGSELSPAAESLFPAQGVRGIVVPESALPLSETLNYTPTAQSQLPPGALGTMTALVADAQLNRWVAESDGQEGPRLAVQRFLADTAMTTMERPGVQRYVVVAPPRTWDPARVFAAELLRQSDRAPWLEPVGLGELSGAPPSTAIRTRAPSTRGLLEPGLVSRIAELRLDLQRLRGILTDPQAAPPELAQLDDALLRATSSRWGADPAGGRRLVNTVDAKLAAQIGRLRLVAGGVVTMTGRSGRIPLTFENDLGQPVRVRVRLDSRDRLRIEGDTPFDSDGGGVVSIPSGTSTLVITGRATTGGLFPIKVEVLSNDGAALGIGATLKVRSTAYGVVALTVTGVAFGLLLVASATRLLRRRRQRAA